MHLHHDGGDPSKGLDVKALLATRGRGTRLYCCGPAGLMKAVREAATLHRWPWEKVHFEAFTAEGTSAIREQAEEEFEVALRSTGQVLRVPAGRSVLNVLRTHGVQVESDCEAGSCGTASPASARDARAPRHLLPAGARRTRACSSAFSRVQAAGAGPVAFSVSTENMAAG